MRVGNLFNGIGGFALAAHWMGWSNVMHCEIDPFCNRVMNYHFPNSFQHEDIRTTDFRIWRGRIDLLTGGDPCQPSSVAGKRKGKEDKRYLWPEYKRAVIEIQPKWIVNENVPGTISNGLLDEKISDLEALGYAWWPPFVIPASAVGAPHQRDRLWLVAHSNTPGLQKRPINVCLAKTTHEQKGGKDAALYFRGLIETAVCRKNHGIPNRVDRIKSLGNSIVPQVAYELFKAIEQYENQDTTLRL